ncbi:MAG: glutaredoxin 3 [Pseudomonadota bacterium]
MAQITVYSKDYCPYCAAAKALLERKGVEFEVIDVSADQAQLSRMLERSSGRRTVPQIFIDELHVGGFDDLSTMDRDGKLDPLLGH